jgi:Deacetylase PdaC
MKSFAAAVVCPIVLLALAAAPALSADFEITEKSPLYELHLRVPASATAIAPLKDKILALHKADADQVKSDAKEDKEGNPSFNPYNVGTNWRVTFESDAVLSLSAETNADTGGAHPNQAFQTIVWDKTANRAVPIDALFEPDQIKTALAAIADAATKAWTKAYIQRSGQKPGADADVAKDGIGADPVKLKTYALTYTKGVATANGIVLLFGAGQVWPHVLGDFRLAVPASVFARYLRPQWQAVFTAG